MRVALSHSTCMPCARQVFSSLDINVACDSEADANYTKKENKMFLIADGYEARDPKTVHLRCPSPECTVRLCAYENGVEHFENFENNNPLLAKRIKAATFGSRQCYDVQMQVGPEGSFIVFELGRQVGNYNVDRKPPGRVGGEDTRSYLRTSTGNEILEAMRKADVTYYPADQWENVSLFLAAKDGAKLPFGLAVHPATTAAPLLAVAAVGAVSVWATGALEDAIVNWAGASRVRDTQLDALDKEKNDGLEVWGMLGGTGTA